MKTTNPARNAARVLACLARRTVDEFTHVRALSGALEMPARDVSEALDVLVAAGHADRHVLADRPLAYSVTPAGVRVAA